MGEKIGYARVSSRDQNIDSQLDKLQQCDKIYQEKRSGLDRDRPEWKKCFDYIREGDTLYVTRLDRLARSVLHLCKIGEELEKKKVNLVVIDQAIDTSTATGRLLFNMLAAIAQFETELRKERQSDGIIAAKQRGVKFGIAKKLTLEQVAEIKQKRKEGELVKALVAQYNVSRATIYRCLDDTYFKEM